MAVPFPVPVIASRGPQARGVAIPNSPGARCGSSPGGCSIVRGLPRRFAPRNDRKIGTCYDSSPGGHRIVRRSSRSQCEPVTPGLRPPSRGCSREGWIRERQTARFAHHLTGIEAAASSADGAGPSRARPRSTVPQNGISRWARGGRATPASRLGTTLGDSSPGRAVRKRELGENRCAVQPSGCIFR